MDVVLVVNAAPDEGDEPGVNLFAVDLLWKVTIKGYLLTLLLAHTIANRVLEIDLCGADVEMLVAILDTAGVTVGIEDGLDIDIENEVVRLDGVVGEVVANIVLVLKGRNTAEAVGDEEFEIGGDRKDVVLGFGPAEIGSAPAIKGLEESGDTAVDFGIEGCKEGCVHLNKSGGYL